MIDSLARRDRRALIAGVAVIGGLLLVLRAVPAWWRWRGDVRASAAESIAREQGVRNTVAAFPQSLDSLGVRVRRLTGMGPAFLTGATPTEAASMLAAALGEIARASLVRIDAIQLRTDTARGTAMPHVRAEVQATADIAGLAALLQGVERGPLLLSVQRLSVRAAAPDASANQVESLTIQFTVEGLALLR